MYFRPPPKLESLPFEALTFPPRCQLRAGLPADPPADPDIRRACWLPLDDGRLVCVADPDVTRALADVLARGEEFRDPLEVVREKYRRGVEPRLYVFGGFTRGAALRLHGWTGVVKCHVYEGTFEDALFYALSENHMAHQSRGHGSARRAVETLLDTPELFERVVQVATERRVTLHAAIAEACRVSTGTVDNALRDRGQGVSGVRLVARQEKHSGNGQTQSNVGLCQTSTSVIPSTFDPDADNDGDDEEADGTESETEPDGDPAADPAPPVAPDFTAGGLAADDKPSAVDALTRASAKADEFLLHARKAAAALDELMRTRGGFFLGRFTDALEPVVRLRQVRSRGRSATVERGCWTSDALNLLVNRVERSKVKSLCAACRGAEGGCAACRGSGFVPADAGLLKRDGQTPYEIGAEVWDEGGCL